MVIEPISLGYIKNSHRGDTRRYVAKRKMVVGPNHGIFAPIYIYIYICISIIMYLFIYTFTYLFLSDFDRETYDEPAAGMAYHIFRQSHIL